MEKGIWYQNSVPTYFAVAGWDGMQAIYDVIKAQKEIIDPDATMKFLRGWSDPNSPRGPIKIDQAGRSGTEPLSASRREEVWAGIWRTSNSRPSVRVGDPWKVFNKRNRAGAPTTVYAGREAVNDRSSPSCSSGSHMA